MHLAPGPPARFPRCAFKGASSSGNWCIGVGRRAGGMHRSTSIGLRLNAALPRCASSRRHAGINNVPTGSSWCSLRFFFTVRLFAAEALPSFGIRFILCAHFISPARISPRRAHGGTYFTRTHFAPRRTLRTTRIKGQLMSSINRLCCHPARARTAFSIVDGAFVPCVGNTTLFSGPSTAVMFHAATAAYFTELGMCMTAQILRTLSTPHV